MKWMRPPEGCESESTLKPTSPGSDSQRKTLSFHCPLAEREKGGRKKTGRKRERKEERKKERRKERKGKQTSFRLWSG